MTSALGPHLKWTKKNPICYKGRGSLRIGVKAELKGYSQFIIRKKKKNISYVTISLLLYFGLVKNPDKTAKEAGLVEIIEVMWERQSASDGNGNTDVLPTD